MHVFAGWPAIRNSNVKFSVICPWIDLKRNWYALYWFIVSVWRTRSAYEWFCEQYETRISVSTGFDNGLKSWRIKGEEDLVVVH